MNQHVIADDAKPRQRGNFFIDSAQKVEHSGESADRGLDVGRWNGDADAGAGAHDKVRCEQLLQLVESWVVNVDGELVYFGGGVAGTSAEGFAWVSVKEIPEDLGDAEASGHADDERRAGLMSVARSCAVC